jgi:hypothetical protein
MSWYGRAQHRARGKWRERIDRYHSIACPVFRIGHMCYDCPPSSAKVKGAWIYISMSHTSLCCGVVCVTTLPLPHILWAVCTVLPVPRLRENGVHPSCPSGLTFSIYSCMSCNFSFIYWHRKHYFAYMEMHFFFFHYWRLECRVANSSSAHMASTVSVSFKDSVFV